MFCATCGNRLNDQNQTGIICQHCKRQYQIGRIHKGELIQIRYCYRCGTPYQPCDTSIWHCYRPLQQGSRPRDHRTRAYKTPARATKRAENLTAN